MTQLFLVRHGESGWNRAGLAQGQSPDAPGLTEAGLAQAASAAAGLADAGPTLVLTSDLRRAAETAAVIAGRLGLPVYTEPRLRERATGAAEGRRIDDTDPAELGFTGTTVTDPDAAPAGGESLRQLYTRVTGLLAALLAEPADRRIVLVTHGGPVRVTQAWLAGLSPDQMPWAQVLNCAILPVPATPPQHASSPHHPSHSAASHAAPPLPAAPHAAPPLPAAWRTVPPLPTARTVPPLPAARHHNGSVGSSL